MKPELYIVESTRDSACAYWPDGSRCTEAYIRGEGWHPFTDHLERVIFFRGRRLVKDQDWKFSR